MKQAREIQKNVNDTHVRFSKPARTEQLTCDRCKSAEYPIVEVYYPPTITYYLCILCMTEAIEAVTGWRLVPLITRWYRISPHFSDLSDTLLVAGGFETPAKPPKKRK